MLSISQDSVDDDTVTKCPQFEELKTRVDCCLTPHVYCVSWEAQLRDQADGAATIRSISLVIVPEGKESSRGPRLAVQSRRDLYHAQPWLIGQK